MNATICYVPAIFNTGWKLVYLVKDLVMIETEIKKKLTVEEFMELTDVHVELIDGSIVNEPAPTYGHQVIVGDIFLEVATQLKKSKLGRIVVAPVDVVLGNQVVQPDLVFISNERLYIIKDGRVSETPEVVFEITSPSNAFKDTKVKFDIYEQCGVKEYFIVYPDDKTVVKYVLSNGKFHEEYREIGFVKSDIMECEVNF